MDLAQGQEPDDTAGARVNNSATGSFKVTVVDTTAPKMTLPADITTVATSATGAKVG